MVLTHFCPLSLLLACCLALPAQAQLTSPKLGQDVSAEALRKLSPLIFPDGKGLPSGQGRVATGALLYSDRCAQCHGVDGRGGVGGELAGGNPNLKAQQADKTIGTYWPYAPTLFDFIRRAMPPTAPWSLGDNEVYSLVAYLLWLNGLWEPDQLIDAASLAAVRMPNRNGFVPVDATPDARP